MGSRKQIWGWCLFDVANSAYTTIIVTVAFNVVFSQLIVGEDPGGGYARGNFLWSVTLAASWAIAAFLGPWLGALSDQKRSRKRFLTVSVILCCVTTAGLGAVAPGQIFLAALLVIVSNVGYALSENFIAAFLPSLSTKENVGKLSGLAWGMGYFGGLASILIVQAATGLDYRLENFDRLRWIGPLTAAFFLVASLPTLAWLHEPAARGETSHGAYARLLAGWESLKEAHSLRRFLLSFFFFQGGLAIVISFAALYGAQVVGMRGGWQAAFFLSLQITAALGAFFFGWLQHRLGGMRALNLTLCIWLVTIVLITFLRELGAFFGVEDLRPWFLLVGNGAGLCLGATQSCARAIVSALCPEGKAGEIFGLWGFCGKLASVFALVAFGTLQTFLPLQAAIAFCSVLFAVSLWLNRGVGNPGVGS